MKNFGAKVKLLLLALSSLLIITSCEDNTSDAGNLVNIDGYVINKEGQPIANAIIKAFNKEQVFATDTTDNLGMFTLLNVPESVQDLKIAAVSDNYSYFEMPYGNAKSLMEKGKLPILLEGQDTCCNKVKVVVKDDSTGNPIKGAQVKLAKFQSDWKQIKESDSTGTVIFENICDAKYWIRVAIDGYSVKEEDFTIDSCQTLEFEIKLKQNEKDSCCDNSIKIWVKDNEGELIKNAKVKLWREGKNITYKISENGYVTFNELCKGKYGFDIIAEGYKSIEFNQEFDCGESKELTKNLERVEQDTCCDGRIKIWVKDSAGELIKNAKVKLWKDGQYKTYKVSENGYVVFEELCKGKYGFSILSEQYKGQEFDYELGCNETKEFTKVLEKNSDTCYTAALKIYAKDYENSEPIPGAKVIIKLGDDVVFEGTTNEAAYIKKEGLKAPAKYLVIVSKENYQTTQFEINFTICKTIQETAKLKKD